MTKRSLCIAAIVLIVAVAFATGRYSTNPSKRAGINEALQQVPWCGRGAELADCPHQVIVGPVDADRGIIGLIEPGMTRRQLTALLGKPAVARAIPKGETSSSPLWWDFFDGVFAWVDYGNRDRVIRVTFDLRAFSRRLGGRQRVFLRAGSRSYLLDSRLTVKQACRLFGVSSGQVLSTRLPLRVPNTHTYLSFRPTHPRPEDSVLTSVAVVYWPPRPVEPSTPKP